MMTIIPNTNVVDVATRRVLSGHDVLFEKGLILDVRPSDCLPPDCTVIPGGPERWVMPGLIDAHVHLLEIHAGDKAGHLPDESLDAAFERGMANLNEANCAGVTTVRDAGAYLGRNSLLRDFVRKHPCPVARILSCGHHITMHGGHFCDRGIIWDRNCASIESIVEGVIKKGADFIKVMNDDRIFDDAELGAIVRTAHAMNRQVACHAFTIPQIAQAIHCGVDTIEHGYPVTAEVLQQLIDSNIALCPTLVAAVDSLDISCRESIRETFPDCTIGEFLDWHEKLRKHLPIAFGTDLEDHLRHRRWNPSNAFRRDSP